MNYNYVVYCTIYNIYFCIQFHFVFVLIVSRDATYADISSELCVVEVNTWILTVRRHWKGPLVSPVLEGLFYITWILIRNVFYPYKVRLTLRRT